jgi:deoxyhypusine monooxygenase
VAKLSDVTEHSMVRHEAAEALGAIATPACLPVLERFGSDPCREVAETCHLALGRIQYWRARRAAVPGEEGGAVLSRKEAFSAAASAEEACGSVFHSVDPVPAADDSTPPELLRATLLDEGAPMFERYRALFALRNRGGDAVAPLLAEVLANSGSALLKHEVCYVLGQLQLPAVVAALTATLRDAAQHAMVRHEAAEALGSIAAPACVELLQEHLGDSDTVVAEGCLVALDILAYETSGAFEYCATE